jgi:hypothetical protein
LLVARFTRCCSCAVELFLFKKYYNTKKEIVLKLWNDISEHFKTIFNLDNIDQLISLNKTPNEKPHKISSEEAS